VRLTSAVLAPLHAEKVLLVREDFAEKRSEEHERLIAALMEACAFCDAEENRPQLCEILAQPQYVNAPIECLRSGLVGPCDPRKRGPFAARPEYFPELSRERAYRGRAA